jgi:multiple sugar transport system ATP-binding protein
VVAIRFDHVWKYFGGPDTAAVADLTLELSDGEFLVMVGPSGCGKTTSLRMLAGLDRPSFGKIWMDDIDVTQLPPGRRDVGMVFQNYALYPNMTVYENLAFGPKARKESRGEIRPRVEAVADTLEIGNLLKRRPSELSGGQRQRVALGRAMIRQPKLFLMDEPLSNLDAALRVQMRAEIVRLHNNHKVTTVYVTHDQVEALTMGSRVAVLNGGRLLQIDTPSDLYEKPADVFVGTFIGSPRMNLVAGQVRRSGSALSLTCFEHTFALPPRWPRLLAATTDTNVLVGLRPHDVHAWATQDTRGVCVRGVVDICEHTGTEVFATLRVGKELIVARLPRAALPRINDEIEVGFDPSDIHLFDGQTRRSWLNAE